MTSLIASGSYGQQTTSAGPAASDQESAKKADELLSKWDRNDMPGCGVGVVRDGKLVYKRAFGMANLDYDVPNTTSTTLFNLASGSKPFTAMSIALLAQQGKLSLDDEVQKYVPEIPKYDHPVTIRHLLYHTSGIREYQALVLFGGGNVDNALNDKDIINMLSRQKNVSFQPGSKYQYSNSNYHLLGIIVGRVSGKSLRAFADENIFKPLGMKNTRFFDDRTEVVKNRAAGYVVGANNSISARASMFDLVGGGGLLTTVEDLYLWHQNFFEPKVGNREVIRLMTAPGILNNGESMDYALGIFLNKYKGLPVFKHSGNMQGYRAQTITFPDQKFTAIALCNNSAIFPSAIVEKLSDIYLAGQFKPEPPPQKQVAEAPAASVPPVKPQFNSPLQASDYVGTYYSEELYTHYKLSLDGTNLTLGINDNFKPPLSPASVDNFSFAGGQGNLAFTRDANGKVAGFVFNSAAGGREVKGIEFKRQ